MPEDKRMPDDDKEQIAPEDRKKLVLTEGVLNMALEMETVDKQMGDVREDIIDYRELAEEKAAKMKQLEGKRDEIRAAFWKKIRAEEKTWFRQMSEAGLIIMYKRVKNRELGVSQIELHAVDEADEAIRAVRRIFFRRQEPGSEE
jgi:hypothetical protein